MRISSIFWMLVFVCAASALYAVKYRVQEMDQQIAHLQKQIETEREAVHVLSAEWAYLTRPERIARLADIHLQMTPMKAQQMAAVADIPFPSGSPVRVVNGQVKPRYVVPVPRMRPGVKPAGGPGYAPAGGVGYVR